MSHSNPSHHPDTLLGFILIALIVGLIIGIIVGGDQGTWKWLS